MNISQYGITWYISGDYQTGAYINGDYWVYSPSGIVITGIDPASVIVPERPKVKTNNTPNGYSTGTIINGSMLNPIAGPGVMQGFDSAMTANTYSSGLNVARPNGLDLSISNPLILLPNSSLMSSISWEGAGHRPQLTDIAILTISASLPASGSFRPAYCSGDKTLWNITGLNWSILRNLPPVSSAPEISGVESNFERSWIEIETNVGGREMHPSNAQPDYGREMTTELMDGMLSLHLNYTTGQKQTLFTRLVQYGIDVYGAAKAGGNWRANGGHNQGRKMPMLLAGMALNDTGILYWANAANKFIFQDDQQVWYINSGDVGKPVDDKYLSQGRPRYTYPSTMIGLPEWGIEHYQEEYQDGSNWGVIYRNTVYSSLQGHAFMAQLTSGAKDYWNWPPFFDYMDRVRHIQTDIGYTFMNDMMTAYRGLGAEIWQQPIAVPSAAWNPVAGNFLCVEFSSNIHLGTALSNGIYLSGSSGTLNVTGNPLSSNTWQLMLGLSRNIKTGEIVRVSYVQPGNGIKNSQNSMDVSGWSGINIVNYANGAYVQPPPQPSGLEAFPSSTSSISLLWTSSSNDTIYIERSLDNSTWVEIGETISDSERYSDFGLALSTQYYYRVRTFNGGGYSIYSNIASATTNGSRFIDVLVRMGKRLKFPTWIKAIPESPYILEDDFEYINQTMSEQVGGWTTNSSNNTIWAYTAAPAPLQGSYSIKVGYETITKQFPRTNRIGYYFMFNLGSLDGAPHLCKIRDINSSDTFKMRVSSAGSITIYKKSGPSLVASASGTIIVGQTYHLWVEAETGNGTNGTISLYLSTTSTKPESPLLTSSAGDWDIDFAEFYSYVAVPGPLIIDKLRIARGPIISNPA